MKLTKKQKDILLNLLLQEMQYCNEQNGNVVDLLKKYKKECHEIYGIILESM